MKKIPKNLQDVFFMFLSVIGYKAKMNKSCQLLWFDFLNHWLLIGKEFIEKLSEKVEVA